MLSQLAAYNETDRARYMAVIARTANADGGMTSEEVYALQQMCTGYVLGPDARGYVMASTTMQQDAFDAVLARLAHTDLRYSLLVDLFAIARADGTVHASEEQEIARAAGALGVSGEHLEAIRTFSAVVHEAAGGKAGPALETALEALVAAGVPRDGVAMSASLWLARQGATLVTAAG